MLFYRSTKKKGALSLFYYIVKAIYGKMRQTSKKKKRKKPGFESGSTKLCIHMAVTTRTKQINRRLFYTFHRAILYKFAPP